MGMYEIITKKKRGRRLTNEDIDYVVKGFTEGSIPDYQMSALLMAIVLKGMNERETFELTKAMTESGDTLDLSGIKRITADKHSTGGVGDKTSFVVGPIVAANNIAFAKMSGRGLGHTGGTIDKLESIPGFKTEIPEEDFINNVNKIGMAIVSQSQSLAPADKKIYALRDVTATVDSIPLIASSIMSKKLAAGSKVIVLDVKCGNGAFMKRYEDAEKLAKEMIKIGESAGRRVYAIISDMNQPLGNFAGNALEIYEALKVLKNEGAKDLTDACIDLSAMILLGAGKVQDFSEGKKLASETLESGKALEIFKRFIKAQGGNLKNMDSFEHNVKKCKKLEIKSELDGYVFEMDTEMIGMSIVELGGGRKNIGDSINPYVGVFLHKKKGDYVKKGETMVDVYYMPESNIDKAAEMLFDSYMIVDKPIKKIFRHAYAYLDKDGIMS